MYKYYFNNKVVHLNHVIRDLINYALIINHFLFCTQFSGNKSHKVSNPWCFF